jgi:hypothetical protein
MKNNFSLKKDSNDDEEPSEASAFHSSNLDQKNRIPKNFLIFLILRST